MNTPLCDRLKYSLTHDSTPSERFFAHGRRPSISPQSSGHIFHVKRRSIFRSIFSEWGTLKSPPLHSPPPGRMGGRSGRQEHPPTHSPQSMRPLAACTPHTHPPTHPKFLRPPASASHPQKRSPTTSKIKERNADHKPKKFVPHERGARCEGCEGRWVARISSHE